MPAAGTNERDDYRDRLGEFSSYIGMAGLKQRPRVLESDGEPVLVGGAQSGSQIGRGRHAERVKVIDNHVERPGPDLTQPEPAGRVAVRIGWYSDTPTRGIDFRVAFCAPHDDGPPVHLCRTKRRQHNDAVNCLNLNFREQAGADRCCGGYSAKPAWIRAGESRITTG
jgi:hypothetical protein